MLEINRDLTEDIRALYAMEGQARLLDLARDAIIVRDLSSRVIFWNRGAEQMYGWTRTEA
jgi:PAS domain-containing protein